MGVPGETAQVVFPQAGMQSAFQWRGMAEEITNPYLDFSISYKEFFSQILSNKPVHSFSGRYALVQ